MYYIRSRVLRHSMANECSVIDSKVGNDLRSKAENPMVHALSGQWPFGKSKLDLKQSSLRRVRSSYLQLASWRAELVHVQVRLYYATGLTRSKQDQRRG